MGRPKKVSGRNAIRYFLAGLAVAIGFTFGLIHLKIQADGTSQLLTTTVDPKKHIITDEPGKKVVKINWSSSALFETVSFVYKNIVSDANFFENLANPSVTYVSVYPGMRREEIADNLQKKLGWEEFEKLAFLDAGKEEGVENQALEGHYYPATYFVPNKAKGVEVGELMLSKFEAKVTNRYASSTKKIISLETALKISSIIEREAAGKSDMRLISGIIWNRLFSGMSLQVDATLQYAKGSPSLGWWPQLIPEDKDIDSPYNTYKNKSLPPTAISNPSFAAIEAALNPKKTKCLFYLHDRNKQIHCTATYEEHLKNIKRYY